METVPVELATTPSRYAIFMPTHYAYNNVVALYTPDRGVVGAAANRKPGVELFSTYHLPSEDAENLAEFFERYVAYDDPENRTLGRLGEEYLCHTLPVFLAGERPDSNPKATALAREMSRDYVPLPEGVDLPPGTHGVVREQNPISPDSVRGGLLHSFVALGGTACIQAFNAYGNLGASTIAQQRAEYVNFAPIEVAVPAAALALAA
jgi:hypothetical protein